MVFRCLAGLILLASLLVGTQAGATSPPVDQQLLQVPQDLWHFAEKVGPNTLLMDPTLQAQRDIRHTQLFFGPWSNLRPTTSAKRFRHQIIRSPRGFHFEERWTREAWADLVRNIDEQRYPRVQGPSVVVRHTDLRSMPTDKTLYTEPTTSPAVEFFDIFQYSSLPLGTPVYVTHVSQDGLWVYVEYSQLTGWARAADVRPVSREFTRAYQTGRYATVVRDRVMLHTSTGQPLGLTHVGSIFPLAPQQQGALTILAPQVQDDGSVLAVPVQPPAGAAEPKPLPLTPGALARVGNEMLGQIYNWGGGGQKRDCSLATRDLFSPFGIWLPRNSRSQIRAGQYRSVRPLKPQARQEKLLREGTPFLTLMGFPGHIGLYVGKHLGQAIMFHNILGLRTHNAEELNRHIIGRCVLSTLEPGLGIPEIQLDETLLQRLDGIRTIQ